MRPSSKPWLLFAMASLLFSCTTRVLPEEQEELETDGMEQAMRQEFVMTHDPFTNTIPSERLEIARNLLSSLPSSTNARQTAVTWQERGPNNVGGRTRAILVDRSDATGNTVLAASVSGGIFRTQTFLTSPNWIPVADNMANLAVTCLWQDRNNASVFYAGTGEGWFNIDAVRGAGIFKSTDGGLTWNQIAGTSNFNYVQDVIQDLNGNLYASVRSVNTSNPRGILRSTDGGSTWTQVIAATSPRGADLEVASNGDLYATLGILDATGVYKSAGSNGANTGNLGTWIDIMPAHTASTQRAEIAVSPSNPQRLYLAMVDATSQKVNYIYRSFNAGAAWDSVAAPDVIVNNGVNSQNWYNLILQVSPTNPDFVIIGGFNFARTTDAGTSWDNITSFSGVHVDQHAAVFISNSSLIIGNDGGIYHSTNADATSVTFSNKNNGYNVTQFYSGDLHPSNPNYFLAGAQDNNTQQFNNAGINSTSAVVGGDGGFTHINQLNPSLQITATNYNSFYRSLSGGTVGTWSSLGSSVNNSRGQFTNPSDLDDAQNVLYSGDAAGAYYFISNLTGTPSGTQVSLSELGSNRIVTAVKVDPFTTNALWLGTSSTGVAVTPMVVRLLNANTTTPTRTVFSLGAPAGASVSSIDVDPNNISHVLVTVSNFGTTNVYETTDGGINWNAIDGNLPDMPVRWGLIIPGHSTVNGTNAGGLMIATELGVWYTPFGNGGTTNWTQLSTGMPNVRVDMLRYRPSDRTVLAVTHGRGLFTTTLTAITTGVNTVYNTKNFIKYVAATDQQLQIVTGNLTIQKMNVDIIDLSGRLVYRSSMSYQNKSIYTGNLSHGSYVVRMYTDKGEYYAQQFLK